MCYLSLPLGRPRTSNPTLGVSELGLPGVACGATNRTTDSRARCGLAARPTWDYLWRYLSILDALELAHRKLVATWDCVTAPPEDRFTGGPIHLRIYLIDHIEEVLAAAYKPCAVFGVSGGS